MRHVHIYWERLLGSGGEGSVYLGRFTDGEWCAIKAPHTNVRSLLQLVPGLAERVRAQMQIEYGRASRVVGTRHVRVFGVGLAGPVPFLALELAPQGTLRDEMSELLAQGRVYHPRWAVARILEVIAAVMETHESNLVHRDIKPDNLMRFGEQGEHLKITDYGIGRTLVRPTHLQTQAFVGTALYAAPEQLRHRGVGAASDLFSVGVVLYEMLMGHVPPLTNRRFLSPSRRFSNITPRLERFLARLLNPKPELRPQSAREAYAEASHLLTEYAYIELFGRRPSPS